MLRKCKLHVRTLLVKINGKSQYIVLATTTPPMPTPRTSVGICGCRGWLPLLTSTRPCILDRAQGARSESHASRRWSLSGKDGS